MSTKRTPQLRLFVIAMALCVIASVANSQAVNPGNGHTYQIVLVPPSVTWQMARDSATSLGGYLGTVTSQNEQDFIYSLFLVSPSTECYLGGFLGSGWEWVTGEEFSYTNWYPGEPSGGGENFLGAVKGWGGEWNDMYNYFTATNGMLVEWDHIPTTIHVPADQPTIEQAVDSAYDGDVIEISAGVYATNFGNNTKSISIIGKGPDSTILVPANPSEAIFSYSDNFDFGQISVAIGGMRFTNAQVPAVVASVERGSFSINNCVFDSCLGGALGLSWTVGISSNGQIGFDDLEFRHCGGTVFSYSQNFLNDPPLPPAPPLGAWEDAANSMAPATVTFPVRFIANNAVTLYKLDYYYQQPSFVGVGPMLFDSNIVTGPIIDVSGRSGISLHDIVCTNNSLSGNNLMQVGFTHGDSRLTRSLFYNNTFDDSGAIVGNVSSSNSGVLTFTARNNIIANNGNAVGIDVTPSSSIQFVVDSNVTWENGVGNYGPSVDSTLNITADPKFCDALGQDFYLFNITPLPSAGPFGVGCDAIVLLSGVLEDNQGGNQHVLDHTPLISWSFFSTPDSPQVRFEIAIGSDSDWAFAELWNPAPFNSPDTFVDYAGAPLNDGQSYWLRLRAFNGIVWSDWSVSAFRMNSVSSAPIPLGPIADELTASSTPPLFVANSSDPESDEIEYIFHVYTDSGMTDLVAFDSSANETSDSTAWDVFPPLGENLRYFWKAKSFDGYEYSEWSTLETFYTNATNSAPTAAILIDPSEGGRVFDMLPVFHWAKSTDEDPADSVRYTLKVALTAGFAFVTTKDSLLDTTFLWQDSLDFAEQYYWKVESRDKNGGVTVSATQSFRTWELGDADGSGDVSIGDAVFLINYIFNSGAAPDPLKAGDMDASCDVNIGDVIYLIARIFLGGPAPLVGC